MSKLITLAFAAFCACAFLFCKTKNSAPAPSSAIKAAHVSFSKRQCLDESKGLCAEFNIAYPVFSGGDSVLTNALNKSVQEYLLSAIGSDSQKPFAQSLDSAAYQFIQMFIQDRKDIPEIAMGYVTEITDTVPFLNAKVATVQMDGYAFTGGAHPNPFGMLISYDLTKAAKPLEITDLVSDTNAVRPALEKAYKLSKGLKETDPLSEVVYPEIKQIPMPATVGVVAEGVRFFYNAYEIAPYAVGASDVLLTWDQLGTLSDKHKWLDE